LTKSIQPFKLVVKDRLFYNRFEYAIGFQLDEVSCLRELDHAYIDSMIERRIMWREVALQRVKNNRSSPYTILSRRHKEITAETIGDLHKLADLLLNTLSDFKLVVSVNEGHIYTNDLSLIDLLSDLSGLTRKEYTRAVIGRPKDTIRLKNPQHQYRSYFKRIKLTSEQKAHLTDFLFNQKDHVRISPALQQWVDQPFNRTQDYFFIDYNSPSWLTMLGLVRPGLIRKTMQIIPAK
jgi:hypothetical protein